MSETDRQTFVTLPASIRRRSGTRKLLAFIAVTATCLMISGANGQSASPQTPTNFRPALSLDGAWRFLPDLADEGQARQAWKPAPNESPWRDVVVPSVFEAGAPEIKYYTGVGWYRRAFRLPADWSGRRIVLHFEAVNYRAKVWLNERFLGESHDGFLPFEFEIGPFARFDGDNLLTLAVDNRHHEGDLPGMHTGWRGFGGILRSVSVYASAPLYLEQMAAIAVPQGDDRPLSLKVRVHNAGSATAETTVKLAIKDSAGKPVLLTGGLSGSVRVGAGESADVALQAQLPGAALWSPKTPVLYTAAVSLEEAGAVADARDTRFGFRRIEATTNGLLLNGLPVFLTGFNRHDDSPASAMAFDPQTARRDLERMKEAGANFVRLCHYPHSPVELDMCDEIGLLAMDEIPMYFWNDREEGRRTNEARTRTALSQLERMIARDLSHPAIIFWSVSNETAEEVPEVTRSNQRLVQRARQLDPSRLCVHVSISGGAKGNFDEDDVVCVNNYFSIGMTNQAGFDKLPGIWRRNLEGLHQRYPAKPILVTEFGAMARPGTAEEDLYARKIEADFKAQMALNAPYHCGSVIWCWADHPWPPGRFEGGIDTSYYGVLDRDRHPKKAFDAARQLFRAKQGL
jgi:hypothetical protein